jgi:hypothetical protein
MAETTSTEFLEWLVHRKKKLNERDKWEYYAAQLAQVVRQTAHKKPNSVKLEHFLIKFSEGNRPKAAPTEREVALRTAYSKAKWFGITGVKSKNVKVRKPPPESEHGKQKER